MFVPFVLKSEVTTAIVITIITMLLLAITIVDDKATAAAAVIGDQACGNWHKHYTALHNNVTNGFKTANTRFLISTPPSTGLADKLVGIPSLFLWALLTGRVFLTVPNHDFPGWHELFDFPHINITGTGLQFPDTAASAKNYPAMVDHNDWVIRNNLSRKEHKLFNLNWDYNEFFPVCLRNNDTANKAILMRSNLRKYPPTYFDAKSIIVETNRGYSYRMFDNRHHRKQLLAWGLTPENAFGCIMRYLFRLRKEGCDRVCQNITAIIKRTQENNSNITVIGIQIRVGDSVMNENQNKNKYQKAHVHDNTSIERARVHLQCANDISEDVFRRTGKDTLYFVISDSVSLLKAIKDEYGDKVLADTETRPVNLAMKQKNHLIHHTISQAFLFGEAAYHVVSADSGFGMMGAWMGNHKNPIKNHIFRVYHDRPQTVCKEGFMRDVVTSPRSLASAWSGI